MSVFNTRKDRLPNGKAKPHKMKAWERYPAMRRFYNKSPAYWNRIYTTKRRRASDRELIYKVVSGSDLDGIAWSPDNYPTIYYW